MKKSFRIKNLGCAHCASKMESRIQKLDGVTCASINFMTQKLVLEADDDKFDALVREVAAICGKVEAGCVLEV